MDPPHHTHTHTHTSPSRARFPFPPVILIALAPDANFGYFRVFRIHSLQWTAALAFMVVYLAVMLGAKVPSWHYTFTNATTQETATVEISCGVRVRHTVDIVEPTVS